MTFNFRFRLPRRMRKTNRTAYWTFLLAVVLIAVWQAWPSEPLPDGAVGGKVVAVKDGDTFEVLMDRKTEVIRLAHVDCPELGQAYGRAAKKFASDLCFGQTVLVQETDKRDYWGRMIGLVFLLDSTEVNRELVRAGYAWHFKRYSKDQSYARLEEEARAAKRGLWADPKAMPPWEWRKAKKNSK